MAKNCFIYETLNDVKTMQVEKTHDGFMHLSGVFGVCGVKNNNQRVYEAKNYSKMISEMKDRIKSKGGIPGELEHPQTMNFNLENISHKIVEVNIDENGVVSGEIVLLNTPKGKIAQAIVEGGLPLYISSRAQGSIDPRTSVVTLESLATYDLVGSPGFSQAELHLNEGQVAESICESIGVVYTSESQTENIEKENNEDMDQALLERLDAMEAEIKALQEQNEELTAQVNEYENIDKKALCDGIQKWIIEEFAPEIQKYIVEQYSPEIQKWIVEQYSPEIQKWIVEQYSPEVQKWCQDEFATGIQNWFIDECAPEVEKWITESYGEEVSNKINEAVASSKKNSLSNIESTLSMLEGLQTTKPVYGAQKTLVTESNAPKYIAEMPADARVKYDMASQEIKEGIDRRARLFDFANHTVNEFWSGVNFETIKPITVVNESTSVVNDREKAIRAQLSRWHASRFH